MNIFFTSDTHFGHKNIMKYCPSSRGHFGTFEEMDEEIINNWNSKVSKNDIVYHLGDFSFCKGRTISQFIFDNLNGEKHLIRGNHDHVIDEGWSSVSDYLELKKMKLVLFHYPIDSWNGQFHNTIHLHGHTHCNPIDKPERFVMNRFDVGIDNNGLFPISYEEIVERLKNDNRFKMT